MHDPNNVESSLAWMQMQAVSQNIRVTQHAQEEMGKDKVVLDDVLEAIMGGTIIENYPDHKRGSCCLLNGLTRVGRSLHVVCTTRGSMLILVTVYEPKPPRWITPTQRGQVENGL